MLCIFYGIYCIFHKIYTALCCALYSYFFFKLYYSDLQLHYLISSFPVKLKVVGTSGQYEFDKGKLICMSGWKKNQENLPHSYFNNRADSRFAPSLRETTLLCNDISHWLGTSLESALNNSSAIDRSHVTTAIWWPLGVAVVSVTCMRVRWVSHTRKYTQWNIFLFESSDKSPYWTNPYHIGFRCEASLNFHTYFGQCPNDTYILLHFPLYVCSHRASDCHGP